MGHSMCVRLHVHVGMIRSYVSARATISIYGWLRHDRSQSNHYIRYRRLGLALSVCICDGPQTIVMYVIEVVPVKIYALRKE